MIHFTRPSDVFSFVKTADKCLWGMEEVKGADRRSLKDDQLMFWVGLTSTRGFIILLCSEKMSLRGSTDQAFPHFSCLLAPTKALLCRENIKTLFKSKEDLQCEGNSDICLTESLIKGGMRQQ